jgi:CheY-like chemotaxis protein
MPAQRILIVDDNYHAALSLGTLLEHMGHDIDYAHDGHAALTAARRHRAQVVFLNLALPGIDGFEVARQLRADPLFAGIRIIALTGSGDREDPEKAFQAGVDQFVLKPVSIAFLESLFRP